ncbi:argininosuccinate lyase [Carnobacterium maltaromaticum]|uniref:Argininosuccinate lyase n=1 Tax=Carnobacterium maltaromaticum TaxID=2751 RepID=A0AAW9JNC9_CARML|nr:argininosuccinate lyase [Carnobacterium maltaromaticum]MDZ5758120.1 argininosuccinate lyase [Carnobacterium maltaromaticum]
MSEKLWGGRFEEKSEAWVDQFGASIEFDQKLAKEDLLGSLAHVQMLGKCKIIPQEEVETIVGGLNKLVEKLAENKLHFTSVNEDIHLNMEKLLHDEIGPVAGKLHTARSRNDQVATDMHLYLKNQVVEIIHAVNDLLDILIEKAESNIQTIMPGYTHLQHAQPISLAHHLLAYHSMFKRDLERLEESLKRIDISPLGCAALAGTTFPIDRHYAADLLGFSKIYSNSLDGVSDRDFILEFLSNSSILMMHLSRFCEEIILWTSHEFQFATLTDAFSTGSSIMPQKKNPDMAELIRGKTGRVYGNLFSLLTVLKGLPLAYNKDLQEDKEGMFDTVETVLQSLRIFTGMIATIQFHSDTMKKATQKDFSNATELADYLATKGIPFREAHEIVGKLVLACTKKGIYLQDVSLAEYQKVAPIIEADIYYFLESDTAVARRTSAGGTAFSEIEAVIAKAKLS